ncbi:MAG: serine hydrolase [Acidobacteria bacterium]|nr:serine hydrolase [Acidobacteriota bacterium]
MVITGCAATLSPGVRGQRSGSPVSAAAEIDALLAGIYTPDKPGATAIVMKDGRVVLRKAYGLANVELQVPMRPESVLALASLSKQFTAAAILKLAEEGRLSLGDDISRFLPHYPTHGINITIEHLLTHTSGLNALSETSDLRAVTVQEGKLIDVLGDWVKDLPQDAAPGERWAYSNWGYNLLGAIIEQVSGQSYADYLRQRIFEPLGMTHTYYADRRQIIPLRATGYDAQTDAVFNVLPSRSRIFHPSGAGGLLSTIDDLARWDEALYGDRILSAASRARMFTPFRLNDGNSTRYGYGWDIGDDDGRRVQEHAGGTTGFVSYIVRMPDDRVFVAILSNRASTAVPLQATAHRVAALAAGRPIPDPVAVPEEAGVLDRLIGTFRGSDVGTFAVTRDGDGLQAQIPGFEKLRLVPVAPLTFRTRLLTWTFVFDLDADGRAARVRISDWKLNDAAERVTPANRQPPPIIALDVGQLDALAGEYESLNGVLVRVERSGDHLTVTPTAQSGVDIYPASPVEFFTKDATVQYTFVRDARGSVAGYLRAAGGGKPVPARRVGVGTSPRPRE